MSFTRVQFTARGQAGTSVTLPAFGAIPTAGNVIFLLLVWSAAGSNNVDVDITDDTGGLLTWHKAVTSPNNTGSRTCLAYAYNIPTLSAIPAITVTRQGTVGTTLAGSCEEWSGFGANNPLSATASRSLINTASMTTNTTAAVAELDALVFAIVQEALVAATITVETVTPAWTQIWDAAISTIRGEPDYKIVTAGGTQICRWTFGNNTDATACIAAFCLNNTPTTGTRVNQIAQSVATQADPVVRVNQVAMSVSTQAAPVLRVNQIVMTVASRATNTMGVILQLDTDALKDRNTPFLAYVKTRAIPPAGRIDKMGEIKDPLLTAAAQDNTTLQVDIIRDFGLDTQTSTVDLTPDGSEQLVIEKCDGSRMADAAMYQFKIGDAVAVESTWDLHHFIAPIIGEDDK